MTQCALWSSIFSVPLNRVRDSPMIDSGGQSKPQWVGLGWGLWGHTTAPSRRDVVRGGRWSDKQGWTGGGTPTGTNRVDGVRGAVQGGGGRTCGADAEPNAGGGGQIMPSGRTKKKCKYYATLCDIMVITYFVPIQISWSGGQGAGVQWGKPWIAKDIPAQSVCMVRFTLRSLVNIVNRVNSRTHGKTFDNCGIKNHGKSVGKSSGKPTR